MSTWRPRTPQRGLQRDSGGTVTVSPDLLSPLRYQTLATCPPTAERQFHAMRVGVIDVGSNTIRLLAADVGSSGLDVVHEQRVWARLGADVARTGRSRPSGSKPPRSPWASSRPRRGVRAACAWRRLSLPPAARRRTPAPSCGVSSAPRPPRCASSAAKRRHDSATRALWSRPGHSTARLPSATWGAVRRSLRSAFPTAARRGCGRSTSARCA